MPFDLVNYFRGAIPRLERLLEEEAIAPPPVVPALPYPGLYSPVTLDLIFGEHRVLMCHSSSERSLRLLWRNLTREQQDSLLHRGKFETLGGLSGSRYRITVLVSGPYSCRLSGPSHNVLAMDTDESGQSLCAYPPAATTIGDVALTQKLMIEHNEKEWLNTAACRAGVAVDIPRFKKYRWTKEEYREHVFRRERLYWRENQEAAAAFETFRRQMAARARLLNPYLRDLDDDNAPF